MTFFSEFYCTYLRSITVRKYSCIDARLRRSIWRSLSLERKEHSRRELLIEKTRWLLFLGAQVRFASECGQATVAGLVWQVANLIAAEEETAEIAVSNNCRSRFHCLFVLCEQGLVHTIMWRSQWRGLTSSSSSRRLPARRCSSPVSLLRTGVFFCFIARGGQRWPEVGCSGGETVVPAL